MFTYLTTSSIRNDASSKSFIWHLKELGHDSEKENIAPKNQSLASIIINVGSKLCPYCLNPIYRLLQQGFYIALFQIVEIDYCTVLILLCNILAPCRIMDLVGGYKRYLKEAEELAKEARTSR